MHGRTWQLNISTQPTYSQDLLSGLGTGTPQLIPYNNVAISWRRTWNSSHCPDVSSHLEVGLKKCVRRSSWTWLSERRSAGTSDGLGPGEEVKRAGEERTVLRSSRGGHLRTFRKTQWLRWGWQQPHSCCHISSEDLCDHHGAGPGLEHFAPSASGKWWLLVALQTTS